MKKRLLSFVMAASMLFGSAAMLPDGVFSESTSITASAESKTSGDWEYYENDDGTIGITGYSGTNTHLKIPQYLDNKRVVSVGGLDEFFETNRLLSVSIPEGVRQISDYAFQYCQLLEKVELPDSLEYIGEDAFIGCTWLEKITIPDNVNYIGDYAFAYCERLKEVNIPQSITNIEQGVFDSCVSLESIEIPDSVTSIGPYVFKDCEKLKNIYIPKSVVDFGTWAFYHTKWMEDQQNNNPLVIVNGVLVDGTKCSGNITLPEIIKVAEEAFNSCENVKTITVPLSVKEIGYKSIGFYNGEKLDGFKMRVYAHSDGLYYARAWGNDIEYEIVDPVNALWEGDRYTEDYNEETGEYHEGFAVTGYAGTEKNIVIPSTLGGVTVTAISDSRSDSSFRDHNNITGVTIPNCVKHIKELSFFNSGNLQKVSFGNGIKDIGFGSFSGCEKLSEISLPDSLEKIGGLAFEFCNSLNTVTIPKNVTEIGVAPFSSCFNLKSINVDKNNKNYCSVDGVLYNKDKTELIECPGKKTSISIPNSVTTISDQAFNSCDELKTVTIPKSVKKFGDHSIGYVYKMYLGFQKVADIKIYGYSGSAAEQYAVENGFDFIKLDAPDGWNMLNTGKRMYYKNGIAVTGKQKIDNKWYYFNADGIMQTGWQKIDNKWYFFSTDGIMQTGWQKLSNTWYFFNTSGIMVTGWKKFSNTWYFFNTSGAMVTGWQKLSNTWYFFNTSGAMVTGWQKLGNTWYFFNTSGAMVTGWQKLGNTWYFFNSSGAMVTGWQKLSNKWYYFNISGAMVNGWQKISNKWYYFESSGAMLANTSRRIGGKTYKFNASGACTNP